MKTALDEEHIFTEKGSAVLFFSRYYSSPDGPRPVLPAHILFAILLVEPNLLQVCSGVEADKIATGLNDDLAAYSSSDRREWFSPEIASLSVPAQAVVELAAAEAKRFGQTDIGPEHLLLALCDVASGVTDPDRAVVVEALHRRGITSNIITEKIESGAIRLAHDTFRAASRLVGRHWSRA